MKLFPRLFSIAWRAPVASALCVATLAGSMPVRAAEPAPSQWRSETIPVPGGADLIVISKRLRDTGTSVPVLAVLRDNWGDGDPDNDRLRYVWSFTYCRPLWWQRVLSGMPFLYWRPGGRQHSTKAPTPILDLSRAQRPVWHRLGGVAVQLILLDSRGVFVRSTTRSYQANATDYRRAHVVRVAAALSDSDAQPAVSQAFTPVEAEQLRARLVLASQPLGGLVPDDQLWRVARARLREEQETRGHNWELLRQRAEKENLLFQPMFAESDSPSYVMLSTTRADLEATPPRRFDRQFLGISNPWRDSRLRKATSEADGSIPLAIYSLDHPRVPLLLIDLRDRGRVRHREMTSRTVTDVTAGVLGLSYSANWYFFAGRAGWDFVTSRRGAARDRAARARSYEELRQELALDDTIGRDRREKLQRQLASVSLNPLENEPGVELRLSEEHYQALLRSIQSRKGLGAELQRSRGEELTPLVHGPRARTWLRTLNIASFGLYTHRETPTPALLAVLAQQRGESYHRQYLARVVASSPRLEVAYDLDPIRRAVRALGADKGDPSAAALLGKVYEQTADTDTRAACLVSLRQMDTAASRGELQRIAAQKRELPDVADGAAGQ